jgi:alkaline phosphatase/streptomycin-6-phosphatase
MSLEWTGNPATPDPGTPPQRCIENQRPSIEPSLSDMTRKAIQLLELPPGSTHKQGFFLQIEGASIDKRDHAADPCGQIGETIAFDRAVQVGLDYAATHPDTLIIVTADHGQTSQIVPLGAHSPGVAATLITGEGGQMKVAYATNFPGEGQEHTGIQVRIAAQGPNAQRVLGVTNQTDLFYTMAEALGITLKH